MELHRQALNNQHPATVHHLQRVAKLSLIVSFATALLLVVAILILTQGKAHTDYVLIIQSLSSAKDMLVPVFLLSGLFLIALTGVLIWIICIYSSARITGALYRFTKNLKRQIQHRQSPVIDIRASDRLHNEAQQLADAVGILNHHYDQILSLVETLDTLLNSNDTESRLEHKPISSLIIELKTLEQKVHLRNE